MTPDLTTHGQRPSVEEVPRLGRRRLADIMDLVSDGRVTYIWLSTTETSSRQPRPRFLALPYPPARTMRSSAARSGSRAAWPILDRAGVPIQMQRGVRPMFQFWFTRPRSGRLPGRCPAPELPEVRGLGTALHARGVLVHPSNIELGSCRRSTPTPTSSRRSVRSRTPCRRLSRCYAPRTSQPDITDPHSPRYWTAALVDRHLSRNSSRTRGAPARSRPRIDVASGPGPCPGWRSRWRTWSRAGRTSSPASAGRAAARRSA